MKKIKYIVIIFIFLGFIFSLLLFKQEKMLFYPEKLPEDYQFHFSHPYKEYFIKVDEKTTLNGLLFKADSSKGLIFYLHGNAGSIDSWGNISGIYLENHYDFFIIDYRGYGKSNGKITSEKQLHEDMQIVYDTLKAGYHENQIIIIGYSIGTGLASKLAASNKPGMLIMKAPFFNMTDLVHRYIRIFPSFLVKYKFMTNEYLTRVQCHVILFHGNRDEIIDIGSSYKLKALFKPGDRLIILDNQKHNGINDNPVYREELKKLLR